MRNFLTVVFAATLLLLIGVAKAQAQRGADTGGEVLMLEEIRIEVAPELPNVLVTIPRQRPEIAPVVLKKGSDDFLKNNSPAIKPRLSDLVINRIEEPEKLLAKERSQ